jgi:hypothetical protein
LAYCSLTWRLSVTYFSFSQRGEDRYLLAKLAKTLSNISLLRVHDNSTVDKPNQEPKTQHHRIQYSIGGVYQYAKATKNNPSKYSPLSKSARRSPSLTAAKKKIVHLRKYLKRLPTTNDHQQQQQSVPR